MATVAAKSSQICVTTGSLSCARTLRHQRSTGLPSCSRRIVVRADASPAQRVPAPKNVTLPPRQPETPPALFGFVDNAERINSRACMIGFFGLIAVEAITNKGFLELIGIRIGSGLGFEL